MERIKNGWRNLSLRKAFIITVLSSVCMIILLSSVTILFCLWGRHFLLPDADSAYLTLEKEYSDGTVTEETMLISLKEGHWEMPLGIVASKEESMMEGEEAAQSEKEEEFIKRYSIDKAESAYGYLTPKRKLAYQALGIGVFLLPAVYVLLGILLTAVWFYRHKLSRPIRKLQYAIDQIQQQNLDFHIESVSGDELGQVCSSLEKMRQVLYQNNQSLWNMLEERRRLQASVAHDLRNPITIIQTYAEYFKLNFRTGNLAEESLDDMVDNLQTAAKRLEQYTDSIRDISRLEEIEVHPESLNLTEVLPEMAEELELLAEKEGKELVFCGRKTEEEGKELVSCGGKTEEERKRKAAAAERRNEREDLLVPGNVYVNTDISALYRILENLVANASRYARKQICLSCGREADYIKIVISDDGAGFSGKVLSGQDKYFITTDAEDGHLGMGLSICRILCRKLGGKMKLYNRQDGGAEVSIWLKT